MSTTLAKWSIADYHRIIEAGILDDRQVELIEGDIVEMVPESPEHAGRGETLAMLLRRRLSDRAWIREARPITLANSEPEPDIAVVDVRGIPYTRNHPGAEDIFLAVEISNTTLRTDLTRKRDLYARAGIPEYWVVDLQNRRVVMFRQPESGTYQQQKMLESGPIELLAFPDCQIRIEDIFA